MSLAPRFSIVSIGLFERDVVLRMPFRFGVVTLTAAPQAFVRARIRLEDGREAAGGAAELLAPKWFDKDPALSNEDNFEQLRNALRLAAAAYRAGGANTAFGHFRAHYAGQIEAGAKQGLNALVSNYGPALIDRALLDALCRALGVSFYDAVRANAPGIAPADWLPEFAGFDLDGFLSGLRPGETIAARHTVGLVDPVTANPGRERVGDGLPETLDEVVSAYGHRWFKIKVAGEVKADIERLAEIAAVLDRAPGPYQATLDGNEQYEDMDGVAALWRAMNADARLARLVKSVALIEQPIKRAVALDRRVEGVDRPVIIDESDDSLEVFPRARALGYAGVSSKTCKGLYKSILNSARCALWNREAGDARMFMSAEDLTIQAGLALQQDLALVNLLGITHVERNGHHYVNGMAALSEDEQQEFLDAHPDLYTRTFGAARVRIRDGMLTIGSLACTGYATAAQPEWTTMKEIQ
ncbi:MAG TPA: enolase C-terminal domain-like protein [Burkholderiales bacterium]